MKPTTQTEKAPEATTTTAPPAPPAPKMNKSVANSFAKLAKAYLSEGAAAISKGDAAGARAALDKVREYADKAHAECIG